MAAEYPAEVEGIVVAHRPGCGPDRPAVIEQLPGAPHPLAAQPVQGTAAVGRLEQAVQVRHRQPRLARQSRSAPRFMDAPAQ